MKGILSLPRWLAGALSLFYLACDPGPEIPKNSSTPQVVAPVFDPSKSDSTALRLAEKVLTSVGGRDRFEKNRYLSFRLSITADMAKVATWRHDWDRATGRYRLEGAWRQYEHVVVYFNLNDQTGRAFINSQPAPEDEVKPLLAMAYSRFLADMYWLLLPFKLQDPGARLEYEGMKEITGSKLEVIRLSFIERVGLTPENTYRIFIDPATNLIQRWEYFATPEAPSLGAWWENWESLGGLKLATTRRMDEGNRKIIFTDVVATSEVDETIFEVPSQARAGVW